MPINGLKSPARGSFDILAVAELGGRVSAVQRRARGQDDLTIRREIVDRFREEFSLDDCDASGATYVSLLMAVQRGVDRALED